MLCHTHETQHKQGNRNKRESDRYIVVPFPF
jgi:hypothetical protein